MYRIAFEDIIDVKKYICDASCIYFTSVLTGKAEGVIWVDQKEEPALLIVWSEYQEGFQLMGEALKKQEWSSFRNWFEEVIVPFLKSKDLSTFEYGVDDEHLADMVADIFADRIIESEKQKIFIFDKIHKNIDVPIDYEFERIDQEFLHKNYTNMDYILGEITAAYGSIAAFLTNGYGYAAVQRKEIAARAIMTFQYEDRCNISVDTQEMHRKKGLSAYLVSKTLEETIRRNQVPIWDCSEDNIASEKTAKKCGFELIREDFVYWIAI